MKNCPAASERTCHPRACVSVFCIYISHGGGERHVAYDDKDEPARVGGHNEIRFVGRREGQHSPDVKRHGKKHVKPRRQEGPGGGGSAGCPWGDRGSKRRTIVGGSRLRRAPSARALCASEIGGRRGRATSAARARR